MRPFKSIVLLMFVFTNSHAQEVVDILKGPDNEQTTKILKVLGENKAGVYYMAAKGDDLYVQRYSKTKLALEKSQKIDIPKIDAVKFELEEMFLMEDQILLFATGFDKVKSSYITYSFVIDQNCEVADDGHLIFEMEVEKKNRAGSVEYKLSSDRTRLLVYNRAYFKSQKKSTYSFILLNNKGEEIVKKGFDVADGEGKEIVAIKNFTLDENNDIHTAISRSLYDRGAKEINERFEVVSYRAKNGYEPVTTNLTLGANNIISSVVIAAKKDGRVALGGFYIPMRNGKKATGIEGTFFTIIELSGEAGEWKTQPFSDEFKSKIIKANKVEKGFDLPYSYTMREAFVDENDQITFIAEDYVFTSGQGSAGNAYYYGYIIAIKVSESGEIQWGQVVNKRQVYQEMKVGLQSFFGSGGVAIGVSAWLTVTSDKNSYLSYKSWSVNGDMVFLFNDDVSNVKVQVGEKRDVLSRALKGIPFTARITADGELSYHQEEELGDEETVLRPRMSYINDGKIYFVTAKRDIEKVGLGVLK